MKRLAVVEDNPDNMMLVRALLEDDYELDTYTCGAMALVGIRNSEPDLVLLDISLPGLDGTQVLHLLREWSSIPVIALTAHAMAGDRAAFLIKGFSGYVSKPIVDDQLLYNEIKRLLGACC